MTRMARFNRKLSRLVGRTNKEIVDVVNLVIAAGITTRINIVAAVNDYTGSVGTCPIGSKVKAVWLETSYTKAESVIGRLDYLVMKIPGGTTIITTPGNTGGATFRKFIFLERKGLLSNDGLAEQGGSPARAAGWLMIPKRFQNMAEGDSLILDVGSSVVYNFCAKIIYKWHA